MTDGLQKGSVWKRIAAWLFDIILLSVLLTACAVLLSELLGYDAHDRALTDAYAHYETEYGVIFDVTAEEYAALSETAREQYDAAYAALTADEEAMYAYNMMLQLTLLITSLSFFFAILIWEFLIPVWLGNGQTLGKRIFGLCLVRPDGVKVSAVQVFVRAVLGKYALETMIPVSVLLMLLWGTCGLWGTLLLFALLIAEGVSVLASRTNAPLHDLLASTVVVDKASQMIFASAEDRIAYQKRLAAERAEKAEY